MNKRQKALLDGIGLEGSSLLDLGCGVGALGLTALQKGAAKATFIDISAAYLAAAKDLAKQLDVAERASFERADAAHLHDPYKTDIVTLDRVVCCYPEAPQLLRQAARLSQRELNFSYPATHWFMHVGRRVMNLLMRLMGQDYRFFLHDENDLLEAATSAGHALKRQSRYGVWVCVHLSRRDAVLGAVSSAEGAHAQRTVTKQGV